MNLVDILRSIDQISEKCCVRSRGHILCSILLKCCEVCYDDFLDRFENGSYQIKN